MADSIGPNGMDSSSGPSMGHVGMLLPFMCAGLVVSLEVWQKGFEYAVLFGLGGSLVLLLILVGLKLYNQVGSDSSGLLAEFQLLDALRVEHADRGIGDISVGWRNVEGTAVLRF